MRFKLLILFVFLFLFFPKAVFASEFSTDYIVSYTISSNSNTYVGFNVTLTNKSEQYYASSYKIQVGFKDVKNLKASDPNGPINADIIENTRGNEITLNFNKRVVGLGNKLNFDLSFNTNEVAQNFGKVWEINIPGLSNQNDFDSFDVNVFYPLGFGKPAFIKPFVSSALGQNNNLSFSKSDLGSSGISIVFGDFQIYTFNLNYHLENNNIFPILTEIALPPSTNYQEVLIDSIIPRPKNVKKDQDGNWLAQYSLNPSQKLNIIVKGKAKVSLYPKKESLSDEKLSHYLKNQPYWTANAEIKSLALKLKTPRNIYDYVVSNLNYDFSRVTQNKARLGAIGVLKEPSSAVCLEFTDLFVALSRAAGIPAREIDGFANTKNTQERPLSLVRDVLHAWPEYYDKERQAWIMIDPTWGNTTGGVDYFNNIDFDHFAFVIKGEDSSYPVPAGGYKLSKSEDSKDVSVGLGNDFLPKNYLKIKTNLPNDSLSFIPISGEIFVENTGNSKSFSQDLTIESVNLNPKKRTIVLGEIPPYGFVTIPISFDKLPVLTKTTNTIKITSGETVAYHSIAFAPFFINRQSILIGGLFVLLTGVISISTIIYRRIRISRQ